jgi:hypothetical protein
MDQANLKKRRKQDFLKRHPICCHCGGLAPATTIDHVPSIQMFSLRHRPRGLEVPACDTCNRATKQHEQVAAWFGRIFSDARTVEECDELQQIMRSVKNNNPGLIEEMMPSPDQEALFAQSSSSLPPTAAGVLKCSGPLVNKSMQIFGAKLGFALHYTTTGHIVPVAGGVVVRWYSDYDAFTGKIPADIYDMLGSPQTLQQGKWQAGDQFSYAYAVAESTETAAYFSVFRQSFAVLSWVSHAVDGLAKRGDTKVHRPSTFFRA